MQGAVKRYFKVHETRSTRYPGSEISNALSNHYYYPFVPVKRRLLESLPSTSETVYDCTPRKTKFVIRIDDEEGRMMMV